jgi:RNA polymerase sigma-70 factor (ECF subfamily)
LENWAKTGHQKIQNLENSFNLVQNSASSGNNIYVSGFVPRLQLMSEEMDRSDALSNLPRDRSSFPELLRRAREGDEQAINHLLVDYRNYMLLVANEQFDRKVQGKFGPSDIVQESMLAVRGGLNRFRGDNHEEFLAWLKAIVKNGIREASRHYQGVQKRQIGRERSMNGPGDNGPSVADRFFTPGTQAMANEEELLLQQALARLPDDYRQILQLRNWQQLTFEEIGSQLNRGADAVRKTWYRALVKLQQEFETPQSQSLPPHRESTDREFPEDPH